MSERARWVVGIDVGGTKSLAGLVDSTLAVVDTIRTPSTGLDASGLVSVMEQQVRELQQRSGVTVEAIGIGIPALLDLDGRAWHAPNLPLQPGDAPGIELAARLGIPVVADNDANCAVVAEHRAGAAKGVDDAVLLTLGTGVGGGVISAGRELRGAHGLGAELGHIVVQADGGPCIGNCPNRGCLESVASGTALVREAERVAADAPDTQLGKALADGELDGVLVTQLAEQGDPLSVQVLASVGHWLGVGLSSLANIFDPALILIGGGVSGAGELLIGPARDEFRSRVLPPIGERCKVARAHFGPEAGLVGAAVLAHDLMSASGAPA